MQGPTAPQHRTSAPGPAQPPLAPTGVRPAPPRPGKPRPPALVLLLFVVTLGVYWFVWLYKAFHETAASRGRDVQAGMWVAILAVVWIVAFFVPLVLGAASALAEAAQAPEEEPQTLEEILQEFVEGFFTFDSRPAALAGAILGILFYVLQAVYLRNAGQTVNEILGGSGLPPGPSPPVAITFCALYAVGRIPYPAIALVASVAGIVVAIVWVVQLQQALNRYWGVRAVPPQAHVRPPPAGPY